MLLLFPDELRSVSRSVAAAAASVSNFLFWQETGYFAASAETNPLLHTWSLAVEEQFYLFFPLVLLLGKRFAAPWLKPLMWLMVLASLALGYVLTVVSENAAFYLLPGRVWELGLGAVVALGAIPAIRSAAARQALALAGALAIAASYVVIRADMPFPVPTALPVCIGTALIIAYGEGTTLAKILALPVLRFIGRISYSVYLWHWPIITFYRIEYGFELDLIETAWLVGASLAAGWASFVLVEKPALRGFRMAPVGPAILAGLTVIAATVALSFMTIRHAADLSRFGPEARAIAAFASYDKTDEFALQYGPEGCFVGQARANFPEDERILNCENVSASGTNVVLMGDSFGGQFAHALPERFSSLSWSLELASGCRPTITGEGTPRCRAIMERVYNDLLPGQQVDLLVIVGRWLDEDIAHIEQSLRRARETGTPTVLFGPMLQYDSSFPLLYARAVERGRRGSHGCSAPRSASAPDRGPAASAGRSQRGDFHLDARSGMSGRRMRAGRSGRRSVALGLWPPDAAGRTLGSLAIA
jgi:peptidoglycan/LPS O-acetylase OafA/YrhL